MQHDVATQSGGAQQLPIYTVHAVKLGWMKADLSSAIFGVEPGTIVDVPIWVAAIEGNGKRILVDTGLKDAEKWSRLNPHFIEPGQVLEPALGEIGWRPRDVDVVINSHLHYDHAENNGSLRQAQFFVQRAEWDFASDPSSAQVWTYAHDWAGPDINFMNYTLVDADNYDVMPGLRVIQTPGHTPGHQSVLVNTAEGIVCVTGDAACRLENLSMPAPPGTHIGSRVALDSINKLCRLSDRILMNHDPELSDYQSRGFPSSPELPLATMAGVRPASGGDEPPVSAELLTTTRTGEGDC